MDPTLIVVGPENTHFNYLCLSSPKTPKSVADWLNISPTDDRDLTSDYLQSLSPPANAKGLKASCTNVAEDFLLQYPCLLSSNRMASTDEPVSLYDSPATNPSHLTTHPVYSPRSAFFSTHTPRSLGWLSALFTPRPPNSDRSMLKSPCLSDAELPTSLSPFFSSKQSKFLHYTPFEDSFPVSPAKWPVYQSNISPIARLSCLACDALPHGNNHVEYSNEESLLSAHKQKEKLRTARPLVANLSSLAGTVQKLKPRDIALTLHDTTFDTSPLPISATTEFPSMDGPAVNLVDESTTPTTLRDLFVSLTPLTPLSPTTPVLINNKPKSKNIKKRKFSPPSSPTPLPRLKRIRLSKLASMPLEGSNEKQSPTCISTYVTVPQMTLNRSFPFHGPGAIEMSSQFPLFYQRFHISSYFQCETNGKLSQRFVVTHPGGTYNPPRNAFDLYTPRFVKGIGKTKVGLCPICVESAERGGENKKLWLSTKFSAFNYHMQYAHGVSAVTALPFSPPIAFRVTARLSPIKTERHKIKEGKCHKCRKWIAVEGVKDVEPKVKEIFWWKHAAACHQGSTILGETNIFVEDDIFQVLKGIDTN